MKKHFVFEGHIMTKQKFVVGIIDEDFESAQEKAERQLRDEDYRSRSLIGEQEVDVDIDMYDEITL